MNEMSALLKRCFEALGYVPGDYVDASAACVWLETHGLDGLTLVADQLPELESWSDKKLALVEKANGRVLLDASGSHILVCGQKIAELAIAMARASGSVRLDIQRCSSPRLLAFMVERIARWNLNSVAYCRTPNSMFCAYHVQPEQLPQIEEWAMPATSGPDLNKLQLVTTDSADIINAELERLRHECGSVIAAVNSHSMQEFFDGQLESGLSVDPEIWMKLSTAADAVLVQATEQSRRGAGA